VRQAATVFAAACFGAGAASLGISSNVGIPLLVVGVAVTCWLVWKPWHEARARQAVEKLIAASFHRLKTYEYAPTPPSGKDVLAFSDHECKWVRAALGDVEAELLGDFSKQPRVEVFEGAYLTRRIDWGTTYLRAFRANLNDLSRRLPHLDPRSDFKPSKWKDSM
jgi:hypothetical protein